MALVPGVLLLHAGGSLDWGSHQGSSSRSPCLGEPSCRLLSLHVGLPPEVGVSWLGSLPGASAPSWASPPGPCRLPGDLPWGCLPAWSSGPETPSWGQPPTECPGCRIWKSRGEMEVGSSQEGRGGNCQKMIPGLMGLLPAFRSPGKEEKE